MKEFKGKSGIYKITNLVNNKVYVGKTGCFYKRYFQYVSDVRNNSERLNPYLRNSFVKHGFHNFKFEVIEFCDKEMCSERELYWMTHFKSLDSNFGYNLRADTSTGMIVSESTRIKISENIKRQWLEGVRDTHSDKLKRSWLTRDRNVQSEIFTETLVKYEYLVHCENEIIRMTYSSLKAAGLANALSHYSKKKTNSCFVKGIFIERVLIDESQV